MERDRTLVGGRRGSELFADTWTFDGSRWSQDAGRSFFPRYVYDLTFDGANGELVFHGGGFMREGRWTLHDETWGLRAADWSPR